MSTLQLDITVNQKDSCILYLTPTPSEPQVNTVEIKVTNKTGADLTLKANQSQLIVTPPNPAAPNQIFTDDQLKNAVSNTATWQVTASLGRFRNWILTPNQDLLVPQGFSITVVLGNVVTTNTNLDGKAYYWSFSWSIATVPAQAVQRLVFIYKPQNELADLTLQHSFSQEGVSVQVNNDGDYIKAQTIPGLNQGINVVFISQPGASQVHTAMTLFLTNAQQQITFTDDSQFIFYFVESNDSTTDLGALASHDVIKQIAITSFDPESGLSKTVPQSEQEGIIQWTFRPGATPLNTYAAATFRFLIQSIFTTLPPYVTLLYVQYKNIPKYKDGVYALQIQKVAPAPVFVSVTANGRLVPPSTLVMMAKVTASLPLDIGLGQPALLAWKTIGATETAISPSHAATVPGEINGNYTFTPFPDPNPPGGGFIQLGASFNKGTPSLRSLQFNLKPYGLIEFDASVAGGGKGTSITLDSYSAQVTLYWQTSYVETLTITDDAGTVIVSYNSATNPALVNSGAVPVTVTRPLTIFTLTTTGYVATPPGPPAPMSPITVNAPPPVINISYAPKPGPKGSILVDWSVPFKFDRVTGSVDFSYNGQVVCPVPTTDITPLPPVTGKFDFPLPGNLAPGEYSSKMVFTYYLNGLLLTTVTKTFTFQI